MMYRDGRGVSKDYKKAVSLFHKAAQEGYQDAQLNLGLMYYDGKGVPKNDKKASFWFQKSAKQGRAFAKYMLSKIQLHEPVN